jgi:hypothetical protein
MNVRFGGLRVSLLAFSVWCFPIAADRNALGQEKDPIKALFDGVPVDLRAKVKQNPVRCDRVNDWLAENVNGKGKIIEMRLEVGPAGVDRSKDGTYLVGLRVKDPTVAVLDDEWSVHLTNGFNLIQGSIYQLGFRGVKTADAEKIADAQNIVFRGKIKEIKLPRIRSKSKTAILVVLEDVELNGSKWMPYQEPGAEGGGPFGADPFGQKKGKSKKGGPPEDK